MKKHLNEEPPHIHMGSSKNELMLKTFLMMSVIAVFSVMVLGLDAFIHPSLLDTMPISPG